jgi:hypothetical protein
VDGTFVEAFHDGITETSKQLCFIKSDLQRNSKTDTTNSSSPLLCSETYFGFGRPIRTFGIRLRVFFDDRIFPLFVVCYKKGVGYLAIFYGLRLLFLPRRPSNLRLLMSTATKNHTEPTDRHWAQVWTFSDNQQTLMQINIPVFSNRTVNLSKVGSI